MQLRRVMKGEQAIDLSRVTWPKYGSYKIDGFRCVVSDIARTSRMKEFPNRYVHKSFAGLLPRDVYLDGEIVVGKRRGPGVLQRTSSGVTSENGEPDWRFWVFDAPREAVRFKDRIKLAANHVKALNHPRIRLVKHVLLHSQEEAEAFLQDAIERGFEGIMLDDPDAEYKQGKSTLRQQGRLKVKLFVSREIKVTGYYEQMENTNEPTKDATGKSKRSSAKAGKKGKGVLGGFIGNDTETGVEVRVGGGIPDALRASLWSIRETLPGQYVTYSKQLVGEKDKPRHPSFIAIRPLWDMDND